MIYDDDDPLRHLGSLREKDVRTKKDVRRSLWSGSKSSDPSYRPTSTSSTKRGSGSSMMLVGMQTC